MGWLPRSQRRGLRLEHRRRRAHRPEFWVPRPVRYQLLGNAGAPVHEPGQQDLQLWIWLKATSTTSGHIKFNVEIIEPVSFTYVALKPVEYSNAPFGYVKYVVGPWRTTTNQQLLFRVSLFGAAGPFADAAFIDDMTLYCA